MNFRPEPLWTTYRLLNTPNHNNIIDSRLYITTSRMPSPEEKTAMKEQPKSE